VAGLGITVLLVLAGILMPAIHPTILVAVVVVVAVYFAGLDWVKVQLFARMDLR
jgi:hypothetical protein